MNITAFLILQLFIFIGAYIQTSTGFAFGLLVMAGGIIMFLSFYNISLALKSQGGISKRKIKCMPFFLISPICVAMGIYILYLLRIIFILLIIKKRGHKAPL